MLLRMYTRWAEQHGYKVEELEETRRRRGRHQVGDAPGQGPERLWLAEDRSAACIGWCGSRRSIPTRAGTPRFRSVGVYPVVDDTIEIDIKEKDVRIDTIARAAPAASTSTRPNPRCA